MNNKYEEYQPTNNKFKNSSRVKKLKEANS